MEHIDPTWCCILAFAALLLSLWKGKNDDNNNNGGAVA
jgi:hypothetical protein